MRIVGHSDLNTELIVPISDFEKYFRVHQRDKYDIHVLEYRFNWDFSGKWKTASVGDRIPCVEITQGNPEANASNRTITIRAPLLNHNAIADMRTPLAGAIALSVSLDPADDEIREYIESEHLFRGHVCPVNLPYSNNKIVGVVPVKGMRTITLNMPFVESGDENPASYCVSVLGYRQPFEQTNDPRGIADYQTSFTPILPLYLCPSYSNGIVAAPIDPTLDYAVIYAWRFDDSDTITIPYISAKLTNRHAVDTHISTASEDIIVDVAGVGTGKKVTIPVSNIPGKFPLSNYYAHIFNDSANTVTYYRQSALCLGMSQGEPSHEIELHGIATNVLTGADAAFDWITQIAHCYYLIVYDNGVAPSTSEVRVAGMLIGPTNV